MHTSRNYGDGCDVHQIFTLIIFTKVTHKRFSAEIFLFGGHPKQEDGKRVAKSDEE